MKLCLALRHVNLSPTSPSNEKLGKPLMRSGAVYISVMSFVKFDIIFIFYSKQKVLYELLS